jgi:hypothetical protein
MKKLKFILPILSIVALLFFAIAPYSLAANVVTATVTAQNISVTVDITSVAYGTIPTSDTKDTTTGAKGVNNSITATNNGNVLEDFKIKAGNSTGSGSGWTLGASAGSGIYTMKYCVTTCDTSPTWNAVGIDPSLVTFASNIAATSGNQVFDLQVGTPTSTTDYSQQSITVTVTAILH